MTTSGVGMIGIPGSFLSGFASAGATPPLSALKEMTAPDASTATALRQEQVLRGARMWISTPLVSSEGGGRRHRCLQPSPPTLEVVQQAPAVLIGWKDRRLWRSDDRVPKVRSLRHRIRYTGF